VGVLDFLLGSLILPSIIDGATEDYKRIHEETEVQLEQTDDTLWSKKNEGNQNQEISQEEAQFI